MMIDFFFHLQPIVIDDDSDEIKIGDVATTSARVLAHDKAKKVSI